MRKKLFITGATGCVGHYVLDLLKGNDDYEIHLLLRDPRRLKINRKDYPHMRLHICNMENIQYLDPLLATMHYVLHIAADWSDGEYAQKLNVEKALHMLNACNANICERIVCFSTASILGKGNKVVEEAGKYGSGYVRSKYKSHQAFKTAKLADRITTVYPTMVFGGEKGRPKSHISEGIIPNLKFLKILRFFYLNGGFHFLHSKDIAQIALQLLKEKNPKAEYALGQQSLTVKETIKKLCTAFNIPVYFQLPLPLQGLLSIALFFRIKVGPWEHYCMRNPYMVYDTVTPETFGLKSAFPTLEVVLEDIKQQQLQK